MSQSLNGKVALITGGTSGIGLATAELFVARGAKVVVADIQEGLLGPLAEAHPEQVVFTRTDVTDEEAIAAAVDTAVATFGRLDIMFNNAGTGGDPAAIVDAGAEGFDKTLALLARSVVLGHKYAARQMTKQGGGGSIVSTASAAGLQGGWSAVGYTAAKHAVIGIVRQAAAELGGLGIRSNAVAPGVIMTPIMAKAFGIPPEHSEDFVNFLAERVSDLQPIGRAGRPEDIAKAVAFLAGDDSEFMTGSVLTVDGGATAVTNSGFAAKAVNAAEDFRSKVGTSAAP